MAGITVALVWGSSLTAIGPAAAATSVRTPVQVVETTSHQQQLLARRPGTGFITHAAPPGVPVITVNDGQRFQTMTGFGAALTDSSAYVLNHDLSPAQRGRVLRKLFSPTTGFGLDYLRIPIGANDFSTAEYTEDDLPAGQTDPTLQRFNITHDLLNLIPILHQVLAINPNITILATPWTAPAWMKAPPANNPLCLGCTIGEPPPATLFGGTLLNSDLPVYASYLVRFVQAYRALGIPIQELTLDNEPDVVHPTRYPGMSMLPAQEVALAPIVGRDLVAAGLKTQIIGFDSSWSDGPRYADPLFSNPTAARYVVGTAFHCYSGHPSEQLPIEAKYPAKGIFETECTGYNGYASFGANLIVGTQKLVIDAVRDWSKTVVLWNLALDQNSGPTNQGCTDCTPNVRVNSATGAATYEPGTYVLAQASRFVVPGAVRIASTDLGVGSIQTVAFQNPDGADVLIALNSSEDSGRFAVRWDGRSFTYPIPSGAVQTFTWPTR